MCSFTDPLPPSMEDDGVTIGLDPRKIMLFEQRDEWDEATDVTSESDDCVLETREDSAPESAGASQRHATGSFVVDPKYRFRDGFSFPYVRFANRVGVVLETPPENTPNDVPGPECGLLNLLRINNIRHLRQHPVYIKICSTRGLWKELMALRRRYRNCLVSFRIRQRHREASHK